MFNRELIERIERLERKTSLRVKNQINDSGWSTVDNYAVNDVVIEIVRHLNLKFNRVAKKDFELVKIEEDVKED